VSNCVCACDSVLVQFAAIVQQLAAVCLKVAADEHAVDVIVQIEKNGGAARGI